jgi:dTDP-4-amino-4,6-dideoxygalactose transaminase
MLGTGFSDWPSFSPEEIEAVGAVLKSGRVNYWTGNEGREFETEFAGWCGTKHAVALANGTLALEACWRALGIGAGDEVIVTPRTFLASASSIITAGAVPVFADVDRDSQDITPETAARVLSPKTRAILCVHLAGWPCEMEGFRALAKAHKLFLVEDCAQAHGATYHGVMVGSFGDISAWSFCQDKIMTTGGEGGMITTNDLELWSKAWAYKDHGKSWEAVYEREHPPGFRWLHESIGSNWRMVEMQAAIGRLQLKELPAWQNARARNAARIFDAARDLSVVRVPQIPNHIRHGWYKAYLFVRPEALKAGWSRDRIIAEINGRGVPCYQGSCSEIYLEKTFDHAPGRPRERLPVARELGETGLMFLVHPTLKDAEIAKTCDVLCDVMTMAQR